MLEKSLYTVIKAETAEDSHHVLVSLNPGHEIFKAHFPGNPILPGVCLLQMALEILNARFGRDLRLLQARNIKFLKVIDPFEHPQVEFVIRYKIDDNLILADTSIVFGETVFARISATYNGL